MTVARPATIERIRVLQIIDSLHIGGAENVVIHLSRALDRSEFDAAAACTRFRGVQADRLTEAGLAVHPVFPTNRAFRHFTPLSLARLIHRLQPDVLHSHGTPALLHTGPLAMTGLLGRRPWIHTFHFGNYPHLAPNLMRGERFFAKYPTRLIAVSDSQREAISRCHNVPLERIETKYNGVHDLRLHQAPGARERGRAALNLSREDIVVGSLAVLSKQKGVSYFLHAASELLRTRPQLKFLVIGGGPLETELKNEAAALGIGNAVVFTGWRTDAIELLPALDVFVMASIWEAMPMVLLEAMAAQRTIVVTDVGDNKKIVEHERSGLVVPAADGAAIAAAIERLLANPSLMAAYADAAYKRFAEHYTVAQMTARYATLYRDAVSRQAQRSFSWSPQQ